MPPGMSTWMIGTGMVGEIILNRGDKGETFTIHNSVNPVHEFDINIQQTELI